MNPIKFFLHCLWRGHHWSGSGTYQVCGCCVKVRKNPDPADYIGVSDKGISFTGRRVSK